MSDADEFVVPYPCFIPLTEKGERLITVLVDKMPAVVFLTDRDLANVFCQEWSAGNGGQYFKLLECENHGQLMSTIRKVEQRTRAAGIQHIALDPGGRHKCAFTTISDVIEYVEKLEA